jgi:hypothetical protein
VDELVTPRLAEILRELRITYAVKRQPGQDVRATLRALATIEDGEAARAVRVMDDWTQAQFYGTAGRLWRQEHPDPAAPVPADLFTARAWPPERIRATARAALKAMPREDGRREMAGRDLAFAAALMDYWERRGRRSAVTCDRGFSRESEFLRFAGDMFLLVGRRLSQAAIARLLWHSKKIRKTLKSRL